MKQRMKRIRMFTALLVPVVVLITGTMVVSASSYGYQIDVDAMKTAETQSDFPVHVVLKKVVEECLDADLFTDPNDVLAMTVRNDSDDTVTGLLLKYVAYDDEQKTVDAGNGNFVISAVGTMPQINELKGEGLTLQPGEEYVLATAVKYQLFSGVRAMIASYENDRGEIISNPDYPAWENLAYGLTGSPSTELD